MAVRFLAAGGIFALAALGPSASYRVDHRPSRRSSELTGGLRGEWHPGSGRRNWPTTADAAMHAGTHLADLLDAGNTASGVWADTAYRSKRNEALLRQRMLVSTSTGRSYTGARCQFAPLGRTRGSRRYALTSSMSSPSRSTDGPASAHHWLGPGDHQDRPRQPRPQHASPALAGTPAGARLTIRRRTPKRRPPHHRNQPQPTAFPVLRAILRPNLAQIAVDGGVQGSCSWCP
jgi:hypothetical protein